MPGAERFPAVVKVEHSREVFVMGWQADAINQQSEKANEAYYGFAERIITLSTGALALSIAFRSSFSQPIPRAIWTLKLSWLAFLIAITSALITLAGRIQVHKRMLLAIFRTTEIENIIQTYPAWHYRFASVLMSVSFAIAMIFLAIFAWLNLG